MVLKLVATSILQTLVIGALLLVPAGTVVWWRAWIYLLLVLVGTLAASIGILKDDPSLLSERLKSPMQKEQTVSDKFLLSATLGAFIGLLLLTSLDVFRFHALVKPNLAVSILGLAMFVAGWIFAYLGMRENAFAAPVVKYQRDRNHTVVSTGPYRWIRHPMYAGGLLVFLGTPLWLGSSLGVLFALIPVGLVALRALAEERFLRTTLDGYAAYEKRVRYRLIPFVW